MSVFALALASLTTISPGPVELDAAPDFGCEFRPPLTADGTLFLHRPCGAETKAKLRSIGVEAVSFPFSFEPSTFVIGPDGGGGHVFQRYSEDGKHSLWTWKPDSEPNVGDNGGGKRWFTIALDDGSLAGSGLDSDWFYRSTGSQVKVWNQKKNPNGVWWVIGGESPDLYVAGETAKGTVPRFGFVRNGVFKPWPAPKGWTGIIAYGYSNHRVAINLYRTSNPWNVIYNVPIDSMIPFQAATVDLSGSVRMLSGPVGMTVATSQALAINSKGYVAGRVATTGKGWQAAIWREGRCHLLNEMYPSLPPLKSAVAISDAGAALAISDEYPARSFVIPPPR